MSTDLRTALREALSDAPPYAVDAGAVIAAGGRRVRRRAGLAVGACALVAAGVVLATAVSGQDDRAPDPAPAEVDRLDLDQAVAVDLDVVAQTRTTWRDEGMDSLEYDRYEGITDDGLVLRNRYTNGRGVTELGLLDVRTGDTDWLPSPPTSLHQPIPLDLATDRLVLFKAEGNGHSLLLFDRTTRTWQRSVVELPSGIEVHMPPRATLGADGRVYVGSIMEGESGPIHWWSAPVPGGGQARPEPDLTGLAVVWDGSVRVTADPDGRVVVSGPAGERVISTDRPSGCAAPTDLRDSPVTLLMAGDRPAVTFGCASGDEDATTPTVMVYGDEGEHDREIPGASARAADGNRLLLTGGGSVDARHPGVGSTYVVDLDLLTLTRVGHGTHESQVALLGPLLLWNSPGPADDDDTYDVTWQVARLR